MKIVVVTGEKLRLEMQSKPVPAEVEFVWINRVEALEKIAGADVCFDLSFENNVSRIDFLKQFLPGLVFINDVMGTLKDTDLSFVRINAWPGFLQRTICETAVANEDYQHAAGKVFDTLGWGYRFVPDVKGMLSARIIAMIINEAYYTLEAGISSKAEIDTAMKLGTNYPYGPFEWGEKIGLKNIYMLLFELSKTDDRYIVSAALRDEVDGEPQFPGHILEAV